MADRKAIARRVFDEIWNEGDLDVLGEIFTDRFTGHNPLGDVAGPEGLKEIISAFRSAFPDLRFTVDASYEDGDHVITRWTSVGTHRGELFGIAPTGKEATIWGIGILRFEGDKVVESWQIWDRLMLLEQLGLAPAAATSPG